jgi:hypothetical protein
VACDPHKPPAEEVWEYLRSGATLVQLHTGLIYRGPAVAAMINEGLAGLLERHGAARLQDVIDERQARRPAASAGGDAAAGRLTAVAAGSGSPPS